MICVPVSWDVPVTPRSRTAEVRPWGNSRSAVQERLSRTKEGSCADEVRSLHAAEERRKARLEEKKRKSRGVYDHAKTVASKHALHLKTRIEELDSAIAARQERALHRRCMAQMAKIFTSKSKTTGVSSIKVERAKNFTPNEDRTLLACLRACQRLACVVARSRLHNARAKLLSSRVKAARQLQGLWRKIMRIKGVARTHAEVDFALNGLCASPEFDKTVAFLQGPRALAGAASLFGIQNKVFLAGFLVIWHPEEALSMSDRTVAILGFAFTRLLHASRLLLHACMTFDSRSGQSSVVPTIRQLSSLDTRMSAYRVLFDHAKQEDAERLAQESFETLVQLRVLFEESVAGSEEKTLFERGFFQVVGKLKRLLNGVNAPDKYKAMLARCAKVVKRRREALHAIEQITLDRSLAPRGHSSFCSASTAPDAMSRREWMDFLLDNITRLTQALMDITPNRHDLREALNEALSNVRAQVRFVEERAEVDHKDADILRGFGPTRARPQVDSYLDFLYQRIAALTEAESLESFQQERNQQAHALLSANGEGVWRQVVCNCLRHLADAVARIREDVDSFHIGQLHAALHSGDPDVSLRFAAELKGRLRLSAFVEWCQGAFETIQSNSRDSSRHSEASPGTFPAHMASGRVSPRMDRGLGFISLEPFADDVIFTNTYRMLAEVLPRLVTGEIPSYPRELLGIHSARTIAELCSSIEAVLCEAHNHMIWKQLMIVSNASLGPTLDRTRCGVSVESVLAVSERILADRGRRLSKEMSASLSRLVLGQANSALRRILARRLSELLTRVLLALPIHAQDLLSDASLRSVGLGLLKSEIHEISERLQRVSFLLAVQ